jgi:hypothetical protein
MAAKSNVSDAADREIHTPHPIYRIVYTYIHLPAHLIPLPADVHNVSRRIFSSPSPTIPPCSSPTPPPVPLWPTAAHRIVSMPTILHAWACMYASLAVWRHVCTQREEVAAFSRFRATSHRPIDRGAASRPII